MTAVHDREAPVRGRVLLLGLLLGCALAACGTAGETPTPPASSTAPPTRPAPLPTLPATVTPEVVAKVEIWTAWDPVELSALRDAIGLFSEDHPEVEVTLAYYPADRLLETYLSCLTSGGCPTILIGPSDWGPVLVRQEAVVDVSAFIDPQLQNDLYPIAWSGVIYNEVMTGLPLELQGRVLYRNTNLVPERSSQLSGLIKNAIAVRENTLQPSIFDFGFYNTAPFLAACEGSVFAADGKLAISGPSALCWLDMLRTWKTAGTIVIGGDEDRTAFLAGRSGWLIDSSLLLQTLSRELGADALTIDPWPVLTSTGEPLKGYVWTENLYLSSRIEMGDLEASWMFARSLFDGPVQALLADPSGPAHIPAQESVALEDPLMQTISAMLRSGVALPLREDLASFIPPVENLVDAVVMKGADPQQALNVLEAQVETRPTSTPGPAPQSSPGD